MPTSFNKSLFWDVPQPDEDKHQRFIIERVLGFGNEEDFRNAIRRYGRKEMADVVVRSRNLDKKSKSFWCQYFHLPNECLSNPSAPRQSMFWRR